MTWPWKKKPKLEAPKPIDETFWRYYKRCVWNHIDYLFVAGYKEAVKKGSGKKSKIMRLTRRKTSEAIKEKEQYVKLGITVTVVVGVVVAGALTGGVAVGILIAVAAGKWLVCKGISEIFHRKTLKQLRHWAADHHEIDTEIKKDQAKAIAKVAKQGMRRAVDHYRKAAAMQGESDLGWLLMLRYENCEDAVLHCHWITSFMHQADKARNYLLPCMDLLLITLHKYKEWIEEFDKIYNGDGEGGSQGMKNKCSEWIARSHHLTCGKECFEWLRTVRHDMDIVSLGFADPIETGDGNMGSVDIDYVLDTIKELRDRMVYYYETPPPEPNYANYTTYTHRLPLTQFMTPDSGVRERVKCLINDVYKKVENHSVFYKMKQRLKNWYTRKLPSEKILGTLTDVIDMGATGFSPVVGHTDQLSKVAKQLVKGSMTLGNLLISKGFDYVALKSGGKDAPSSVICHPTLSLEDLKAQGLKATDILSDMAGDFKDAYNKTQKLLKLCQKDIHKCSDITKIAMEFGKAKHLFATMEARAMAVLGIVHPMAIKTITWSNIERSYFREMRAQITAWLCVDADWTARHTKCVKCCYRPSMSYKVPFKPFK